MMATLFELATLMSPRFVISLAKGEQSVGKAGKRMTYVMSVSHVTFILSLGVCRRSLLFVLAVSVNKRGER